MSDVLTPTPLSPLEILVRNHALLCTIGFLILLPVGALIPRYTRLLPYKWFYAHWLFQFVIAGPVIYAGWSQGHKANLQLGTPHFQDPHEKIGLVLLILYVIQLCIGAFTHFFKFSTIFRGHRPPHSYFHVLFGFAIIILAQYNVHYGLYTEWDFATGGEHQIPPSAKHAWLALVIAFWVLYALGLGFVPWQFKREKEQREKMFTDMKQPKA